MDRVGLAGLTMRSLADELGVTPMASYYYVGSRDDLVCRVADELLRSVRPTDDLDRSWDERLWEYMRAMTDVVSAYPGLSDFLLRRDLTLEGRRYISQCIEIIERGGFEPAAARDAFSSIYAYMWGRGVFRSLLHGPRLRSRRPSRCLAPSSLPTVEELASAGATELGFRALVAGLEVALRDRPWPSTASGSGTRISGP
jgi:AcrR family transcriptional regulator